MSSISSIDTSIYSALIDSFYTMPSKDSYSKPVEAVDENISSSYESVDLSNYYSNIESTDLLTQLGQNVVRSAEELDNAMVSAIQNGFSVQDVCNMKLAEVAYKANCTVMKSTFELEI